MRSVTDFEYEWKIADINRRIAPQLETFALFTPKHLAEVSSGTVKEIARHNGWRDIVSELVPDKVFQVLKEKKLQQRWDAIGCFTNCFEDIKEAYSGKAYHNFDHLLDMLEALDECDTSPTKDIELAVFMHDLRETPEESAQHFRDQLYNLIISTNHKGNKTILTDLDLAILGKSPEKYAEYRAKVRQEYSQHPIRQLIILFPSSF